MSSRIPRYLLLAIICISAGCANITTPTGGKKDTIPPKLVSIDTLDSQLNTKVSRIEMHFDEYITVSDVAKEVELSPILTIQPVVLGKNKTVIVKIVDSLLEPNTTYRLSFGKAIKDLHEGNPFHKYTYTFSTGPYFDSLQLHGNVINAATGLPDTGNVIVELYSASETDSAVVQRKPKYITKVDASGGFIFKGLPKRNFRIYALKDANNNLIYDGPSAGDMIGFIDSTVVPSDTSQAPINLAFFMEKLDTASQKNLDSTSKSKSLNPRAKTKSAAKDAYTYSVNLDTTNLEKRTFDITGPVNISFSKLPLLNKDKITLTYDTAGQTISPALTMTFDSLKKRLQINTEWLENTVYKLRLVKGFAKDTAGTDLMPSRYFFRTKDDDDYGKITLYLPAKYSNPLYVLRVMADDDSVYQQPVTDTMIILTHLKVARYTFRIIVDKNRNGKWDTGDLLAKQQPEKVIPYKDHIDVRAGFEYTIDDFEPKPPPKPEKDKKKPKQK